MLFTFHVYRCYAVLSVPGCYAFIVALMACACYSSLSWIGVQCVLVAFPSHTHLLLDNYPAGKNIVLDMTIIWLRKRRFLL